MFDFFFFFFFFFETKFVTRRRFNFIIMVTKIVEVADTDCYCGVCSWPKMGSVVSEVMIDLTRSGTPDARI